MQMIDSETFDLLAPPNLQDPFSLFVKLRREKPVYWSEKYSFWLLTRYQDVKTALRARNQFSSATGVEIEGRKAHFPESHWPSFDICKRFAYTHLQTSDEPKHSEHRQAVMGFFTPQAIAELRLKIQQRTDKLLDQMESSESCDFVTEFARPLPSLVIFDLLGIPAEFHETFLKSSRAVASVHTAIFQKDTKTLEAIAAEFLNAERAITQIIDERKREPKDDLISRLATTDGTEAKLATDELVVLCNFLLFAGHETTTNLLSGSLRYLLESRELWERLSEAPELMPSAVEELLRFVSPVLWVSRVATEDIGLGGEVLRKGQRILLGVGAGNHDPSEFDQPEQLDFTRPKVNSLAFGYGAHFCLGAALARMEAQIALSTLLDRVPGVELGTREFDYHPVYILRALKSLPIVIRRAEYSRRR
jgi:cytochrome P450